MTIYLIVPPERLHSHSALLRLWVGALLRGIFSRQRHPELKTLFLLDEMSQLGTFPYFETMVTLCAGYGVWCWSFWQDLAQLQSHYTSWRTILNNCAVQVFGINNRSMATQWGEHLEHSPRQLAELGADEQVLLLPGSGEQLCQRPNYLRDDDLFAGLYDANRFYEPAPKQSAAPSPRLP